LLNVLLNTDMRSLFNFRQANLSARRVVGSIAEYQKVVTHALSFYCALLRTETAANFTLLDCFQALCTKACAICKGFSGCLSLITGDRCCFRCLYRSSRTEIQTLQHVQRAFHLTKAEQNQLRTMKVKVGAYPRLGWTQGHTRTVVSCHQVQRLFGPHMGLHGSRNIPSKGACVLPYYDRETDQIERGVCCAGCLLAAEKDRISMDITKWESRARDTVYARDGFLEHFKWCEFAQRLWISSEEGSRQPPDLPRAS
jgi:hypothetical protein